MKKYLPFSRRQPSLDRFAVSRGGWAGSDRFNGKSLRRTSAASLNTRSIQVVRGAYNIDLNKVDSSFTKLHRACLLNDDVQAKKQLHKVDNNSHDSSKRYPIHLATVNGNLEIIKLLIENGADPNVQDNEGNTPLIKSLECGHEHLVKYLLSNGADPNISDMDNNTALHWAIMTESIIAIDALLCSKKCDFLSRNNKDETCLHLAVRSPLINTFTFESMVKNGSDLNAKDQLGLTVLDIAQACNNKVAMNAFNRCNNGQKESPNTTTTNKTVTTTVIETGDPIEGADVNRSSDNETTSAKKLCDEYKQKYMTKNRENLEYEKKLIQLNSQIERLRLDLGYIKEQNEKLESDYEKLREENSKLKIENSNLLEQINKSKYDLEKVDSIECRGHENFIVARALNQERINKLKSNIISTTR